jgi:hypothetical protein
MRNMNGTTLLHAAFGTMARSPYVLWEAINKETRGCVSIALMVAWEDRPANWYDGDELASLGYWYDMEDDGRAALHINVRSTVRDTKHLPFSRDLRLADYDDVNDFMDDFWVLVGAAYDHAESIHEALASEDENEEEVA